MKRNKRLIRFLCVVGFLFVFSSASFAHSLFGKVDPQSGRNVTVELMSQGQTVKHTVTAETGEGGYTGHFYAFRDLEDGIYDLKLSKPGFLPVTIRRIGLYGDLDLSKLADRAVAFPELIAGDISGDDFIDAVDVTFFMFDMARPAFEARYEASDLNGDLYRDALDATILSCNLFFGAESYLYTEDRVFYGKRSISAFDDTGNWQSNGTLLIDPNDRREGSGCLYTVLAGDTVFWNETISADLSAYPAGGRVHLRLYVDDASAIYGGQIEFTSSGRCDRDEIHFGELGVDIPLTDGWNELDLAFSDGIIASVIGGQSGIPDLGTINYCRIYVNYAGNASHVTKLDDFYLYFPDTEEPQYRKRLIDDFDPSGFSWESNIPVSYGPPAPSVPGGGSLVGTGSSDLVFYRSFDQPLDLSFYQNGGMLHLMVYAEGAARIYGGQIEFSSSGVCDRNEAHFGEFGQAIPLSDGWNTLDLPFSSLIEQGGEADLSRINLIRIYFNTSGGTVTCGLDDLYVYRTDPLETVLLTLSYEDTVCCYEYEAGKPVCLSDYQPELFGYDLVGWEDGDTFFGPDDSFAAVKDVTLTARLAEWKPQAVTYRDSLGNSLADADSAFAGSVIKTDVCPFYRFGYSFDGWWDGEQAYLPGHSYRMKQSDNVLTARWCPISDAALLKDAVEAWELNDGGPAGMALSSVGRSDAVLTHTVWLENDTFGRVLDFSCDDAKMTAVHTAVDLSRSDFSISVWLFAPVRETGDRGIVSCGDDWSLYLEADTGYLSFYAAGLNGLLAAPVKLDDGRWHHVLVSRNGGVLTYYADGNAVKTCSVTGQIRHFTDTLTVGDGFDGSLAQLRIWDRAKTPAEATGTVLSAFDATGQRKDTRVSLMHGITTDRSQGFGTEGGSFTVQDSLNCASMGFDFVRMMVYVDNLIGPDGSLQTEYIEWAKPFCQAIIDGGEVCLMSLGCGDRDRWNGTYLTESGLDAVCRFYGELAEWIREQGWTADEFALLLYTEPVNASKHGTSWTYISDRIVAAVRNVLPEMTIVTSSDQSGSLEQMLAMSPMTDSNLVYSFTSYEPYVIGFNTFQSGVWSYVKDLPYPILEGVDYTDAIENAIALVPQNEKNAIRQTLRDYVSGTRDVWKTNSFGGLYNADWLMRRASLIHDWSERNGGVHVLAAEFGAADAVSNIAYFGAAPGSGLPESTRLSLIRDSRIAYETYGIGWAYWEYNEGFTVYHPSKRLSFWCVDEHNFREWVYPELLSALGLMK